MTAQHVLDVTLRDNGYNYQKVILVALNHGAVISEYQLREYAKYLNLDVMKKLVEIGIDPKKLINFYYTKDEYRDDVVKYLISLLLEEDSIYIHRVMRDRVLDNDLIFVKHFLKQGVKQHPYEFPVPFEMYKLLYKYGQLDVEKTIENMAIWGDEEAVKNLLKFHPKNISEVRRIAENYHHYYIIELLS